MRAAALEQVDLSSSGWRVGHGLAALEAAAPAWLALEACGRIRQPFDRYDLVRACAEAAGPETILIAELGTGLDVSILPLRMVSSFSLREAVSLAAPFAQYASFAGTPLGPDDLCGLLGQLRTRFGVDALRLRKVREDSPLAPALVEAGAVRREAVRAPFLDLARFSNSRSFEAGLSSNLRRSRRQRLKRLEEEFGPVEFRMLAGSQAGHALDRALVWKREWLTRSALSSAVIDGGAWERALRACASGPAGRIGVLSAGGCPVSIEIGFVQGRGYVSYLGAFDPDFARFSVGSEQIARSIAWCIDEGLATYDFLAPEDEYKRAWVRDGAAVEVADYTLSAGLRGRIVSDVKGEARVLAKQAFARLPRPVQAVANRCGLTRDPDGALRWGGVGVAFAAISTGLVACD